MKYKTYEEIPNDVAMRIKNLLAKQVVGLVKSLIRNGDYTDNRFAHRLLIDTEKELNGWIDEIEEEK